MNTFTHTTMLKNISRIAFICVLMLATLASNAQEKIRTKTIGNKPRNGSSNSTYGVVQGNEVGIKMKAGSKPVQLLKLNFASEYKGTDSIPFKVNVYEFKNDTAGANLVTQEITAYIKKGKFRNDVNLEPYNIMAKGNILVSIEWLKTVSGPEMSFSIGLFNGGTYHKDNGEWKKTPVVGADFNVLVKK